MLLLYSTQWVTNEDKAKGKNQPGIPVQQSEFHIITKWTWGPSCYLAESWWPTYGKDSIVTLYKLAWLYYYSLFCKPQQLQRPGYKPGYFKEATMCCINCTNLKLTAISYNVLVLTVVSTHFFKNKLLEKKYILSSRIVKCTFMDLMWGSK